ncbi:PH domain-containing protein [Pseudalkalibacillus salsuginis]|uniref:PH domain-containing protein n=1 Tax=Pseudalkalibacillus salsuginis TaxID=2910972 RepID=UPI001F3001FD|nr:PH domain-containing protein [Pseudalkalibacillus salsuginis]MCF6411795.1 PH domain-containing protein [Pseudalkalibacillus salsuginis]
MYDPTRLHPLAAGLSFLKMLKEWIIPLVLFLLFGPGSPEGMAWVSFAPFIFVLLLGGYGILHWYRFTYHIEGDELKIEYGVFVRKKRYIPKNRIQSIDYTQGIFHRAFDVVKINIETAGGPGGAEASLSAVRKTDADQLALALREEKKASVDEIELETQKEEASYTYKLSLKDLLLAASTSGGIGVALPLTGTLSSQFDTFLPDDFYVEAFNWLSGFSWIVIAVMAFLSVFIAWFVSFIGVILKYANFQINKFEDRIVISRGLLEKRELTLPLQRIQGLRVVESIFRQPFGFSTVHVESAGGAGPEMGVSAMLFPFIKRSQINDELAEILESYHIPEEKMVPLPKRAMRRYILRNAAPVLFLIPLFWFVPTSLWFLLFIPLPILVMWGILDFKDSKWLIDGQSFYIQTRTLSRCLLITKKRRMQDFEIKQSIFQKRHDLMTMKTAILSGGVGKVFQLKDIEFGRWREVCGWFSRKY